MHGRRALGPPCAVVAPQSPAPVALLLAAAVLRRREAAVEAARGEVDGEGVTRRAIDRRRRDATVVPARRDVLRTLNAVRRRDAAVVPARGEGDDAGLARRTLLRAAPRPAVAINAAVRRSFPRRVAFPAIALGTARVADVVSMLPSCLRPFSRFVQSIVSSAVRRVRSRLRALVVTTRFTLQTRRLGG